jgi:parallel beta-helix repeat protein
MTTYYVSTTGSDNGSGTQTSPWATINHALEASLKPGDTIMVAPGTYNEAININTGGSAAGNITLESTVPGGALIRPPAGSFNAVSINANYVTIDGFDVKGGSGAGIAGTGVAHVSVLNNIAHDSGQSGISFVHSDFETIEGNTTYNNASTGYYSGISVWENQNVTGDTTTTGYRTIIANNTSYNNVTKAGAHSDGNGIIIDDFQSTQTSGHPNYTYPTLVQGNLVYGNGGKGIQVYDSDNVTVANNTAYHNNQDTANTGTWRGEISNSGGNNNTFVNNIAVADPKVNPNNTAISNTSDNGANKNVVWADNITYNGANGQASVNNDGGNSVPTVANGNMLGVDPKFVQSGADFHLQGSSPALNAGANGYGLATSGAVNIGAEGASGTTSVPVDSGTTSASTGSGATSAPTGGGTTSASTGSGVTSAPTGGGTTSTSTGSGTTSAPTGSGTTSTSTGSGTASTSDGNSGISHSAHTWHDARAAFHDAMSTSVNDWNATKAAPLQNAFAGHGVTRGTLQNAQKVMNLLNGVDTTDSTQVSAVNAQTSKVQSQTLNTVNHDATLAAQTVGADGSTGVADHHGQNDFSLAVHHFGHLWG